MAGQTSVLRADETAPEWNAPGPSPAWRRELVAAHADLARRVARGMVGRFPRVLDEDEVIGAAFVGFLDATRRFDPHRGVPFEGYAVVRIRGAILDSLRKADRLPTPARRKQAHLDHARAAFEARHGRAPTSPDLAELMDLDVDAVETLRLGAQRGEVTGPPELFDRPAPEPLPDERVDQARWLARMHAAIDTLPERERIAVCAYRLEERPLAEVADCLGVTPSRVCQLCRRAIARMRAILGIPP